MLLAGAVATHHLTVAANAAPVPPICLNGTRYVVSFDDEFTAFQRYDSASGHGTWDTAFPWGRRNPGARDAALYVDDAFALGADGLTISASVAPPAVAASPSPAPYVSGVITTRHSFAQTYGYFEARLRLPRGRGLWPAFWLLPTHGYPPEIDVVEVLEQSPQRIYQTTHGVPHGSGAQIVWTRTDSADGFHSYGVAWTHTAIVFYVDGTVTGTVANISDQPMYLLANLQVGEPGSWPGAPDGTNHFPASMTIRYVRGYTSAGTCAAAAYVSR